MAVAWYWRLAAVQDDPVTPESQGVRFDFTAMDDRGVTGANSGYIRDKHSGDSQPKSLARVVSPLGVRPDLGECEPGRLELLVGVETRLIQIVW